LFTDAKLPIGAVERFKFIKKYQVKLLTFFRLSMEYLLSCMDYWIKNWFEQTLQPKPPTFEDCGPGCGKGIMGWSQIRRQQKKFVASSSYSFYVFIPIY
jgi:hypothetical protein